MIELGDGFSNCIWSFLKSYSLLSSWFLTVRNGHFLGRGGAQVVSVLAFYSNDPSSNPADIKFVLWMSENLTKRGRGWPIFLKRIIFVIFRSCSNNNLWMTKQLCLDYWNYYWAHLSESISCGHSTFWHVCT